MDKNLIFKIIDSSIDDQINRVKRFQQHFNAYLTASSIVLLAEVSLFTKYSDWYLFASKIVWMFSLLLLVFQFVTIALSYLLLITGRRANLDSPLKLLQWYKQCVEEEKKNGKASDDADVIEAIANANEKKYSLLQEDIKKYKRKFLILCWISISMVTLFALFTIICCFYSCALYPNNLE